MAATTAPNWHEDYTEALAAARADRKPLLVVIYNSGQSQRQLQLTSQTTGETATLLDNYHLCRIDASTPNGKRVAGVFKATTYPYTVITDRNAQKIIFRRGGAFNKAQWIETLADYRRGSKPVAMTAFSSSASTLRGPASAGAPACAT